MHGYILRTGARLQPFGDPIGDTLILNRRLEDHQKDALGRVCQSIEIIDNLSQIRADEFLLIEDHLYVSPYFLKKALRQEKNTTGPKRFAVGDSVYLQEKAVLGALVVKTDAEGRQSAPLALVWWRGESFNAQRLESLPITVIAIKEKSFVPENLKLLRDDLLLRYAITREGVLSVRHWSHVLDATQLALAAYWLNFSPLRILWVLWKLLSALSLRFSSMTANVNRIGRGCQIHPTAWVIGSVLGDYVQVGPYSVVFGSVLGDRARVESHCEIVLSALGEKAVVGFAGRVALSVMYPMSMSSYPAIQMCLLGRRALHMGGNFPIDMKLTRGDLLDVKVKSEGRVVDSGKKFLGMCVGHGSIVGTGMWMQSGVEVPNDYIIVRDKVDIVTRIPPGMEGKPLSLQGGELREYGSACVNS